MWLVRAVVPRGLLRADVVEDECADRVVRAGCRLAGAGQRRSGPCPGGVDPAPRRHARRPDRAPLGGVLLDQELGQLRGRRGAGHGDGGRAGRARPLAAVDRAAGGAGRRSDRPGARDPAAGTGSRPGPGRLAAASCGRRRSTRRDRRDRRGRRDLARTRSDRHRRRDRLLGLRQRRPVGHASRPSGPTSRSPSC